MKVGVIGRKRRIAVTHQQESGLDVGLTHEVRPMVLGQIAVIANVTGSGTPRATTNTVPPNRSAGLLWDRPGLFNQ